MARFSKRLLLFFHGHTGMYMCMAEEENCMVRTAPRDAHLDSGPDSLFPRHTLLVWVAIEFGKLRGLSGLPYDLPAIPFRLFGVPLA